MYNHKFLTGEYPAAITSNQLQEIDTHLDDEGIHFEIDNNIKLNRDTFTESAELKYTTNNGNPEWSIQTSLLTAISPLSMQQARGKSYLKTAV